MSRVLTDDLVRQLRNALALERAVESLEQQRSTINATGTLMLAAVEAGWKTTDIAKVLDMKISTASKRVRDARARRGDTPLGLVVDAPPIIRAPLAELNTSLDDRQWLGRGEAANYLGVSARSIQNYKEFGLLPNTRELTRSRRVYLRADLDRVRHGPRRGLFLDRVALRESIRATSGWG